MEVLVDVGYFGCYEECLGGCLEWVFGPRRFWGLGVWCVVHLRLHWALASALLEGLGLGIRGA